MKLTILVHGDAGVGKSWLFASAPGPRLYFDGEGRAEYLPKQPVVYWDPRNPLPADKGDGVTPIDTDTTIVVTVRSWADVEAAKKVLISGNHYFKSVGFDSVTEIQDRVVEAIRDGGSVDLQDWGEIYDKLNDAVRELVDLRTHPTNPLDVIYVVAGSELKDNKVQPYVRGQLSKRLPYRFDVVGYLARRLSPEGKKIRDMLVDAIGTNVVALSHVDQVTQAYPAGRIADPDLTAILAVINQPEEAPTA